MFAELVDAFFGDALETTLHMLIACASDEHTDPITYVCSVVMSQGVSFCFTEEGVMPFLSKPDLVILYDFMSKHQLRLALQICENMESRCTFSCSTKMGKGFCVREDSDNQHYVQADRVVACASRLLRMWNADEMTTGLVVNRLLGYRVPPSVQSISYTECQGDVFSEPA
jgi:hypothetical protein